MTHSFFRFFFNLKGVELNFFKLAFHLGSFLNVLGFKDRHFFKFIEV